MTAKTRFLSAAKSLVPAVVKNHLDAWQAKRTIAKIDSDSKAASMMFLSNSVGIEYQLKDFEGYLRAGSGKLWATYKSCRLVADVICTTDYMLQTGSSTEPVTHKRLSPLLERPNQFDNMGDFIARWVFHMKLTGNAFALLDEFNGLGEPTKVWLLNPKQMQMVVDKKKGIVGWIYMANGARIPYDVDEIIHWRLPHPDSEFWGMGEIEGGRDLVNQALAEEAFAAKFFQNGATPSGIVTREEEMEESEFKKLKAKFQKEYGGSANSGKTAWLTGKWDYKRLGLSLVDMERSASKAQNTDYIFALHGIPLSMAGVTEASNYATSKQADVQLRRYTVLPLLKIFATKWNERVVHAYSKDLWFVFNLAGLAYIKEVVEDYKELMALGGITPNELRDIVGMDRLDDPFMDEVYLGTHLVPMSLVGVINAPPAGNEADNNATTGSDAPGGVKEAAIMVVHQQKRLMAEAAKKKRAALGLRMAPAATASGIGKPHSPARMTTPGAKWVGKPSGTPTRQID